MTMHGKPAERNVTDGGGDGVNVRRIALETLKRAENGGYSNLSVDAAIRKYGLRDADKRLLSRLVLGVIEKKITLDYYISALSTADYEKTDAEVKNALRMGMYQLMYTDRIPPHAAVFETVAVSPRKATKYVNAVLRRYIREGDKILKPERNADFIRFLSVEYSFPEQFCERTVSRYGKEKAEDLLRAFCVRKRLHLKVNDMRVSRDDLKERFQRSGLEVRLSSLTPGGLMVENSDATELPGFADGDFFVQNISSQLCVDALDARPGMRVLDACAAPGSKSFGIAVAMKNKGSVFARDIREKRVSLIEKEAERLRLGIISTAVADARERDENLSGRFDRVLCDVPCSGFGVVAEKPEIRYKKSEMTDGLPEIQYAILENCSAYLAPGADMIYSTCTIFPEENENVVERFLKNHSDFALKPVVISEKTVKEGMMTVLPEADDEEKSQLDGFFIAHIRRVGGN